MHFVDPVKKGIKKGPPIGRPLLREHYMKMKKIYCFKYNPNIEAVLQGRKLLLSTI
jgi:hypothetical protein